MSDNKWTPEPWHKANGTSFGTEVFKRPYGLERIANFFTEEDAERAVECVNALAGQPNPKEYIETILKQRDELAIELANIKSTLDNAMAMINRNLP